MYLVSTEADEELAMTYLVITVVEIEAESVNEAADLALDHQEYCGFDQFVQVKNEITTAAAEAALEGAQLAVAE